MRAADYSRNAVTPQALRAVGLLMQGYQSPDGRINIAPMSLDAAAHLAGSLQQESYLSLDPNASGDAGYAHGVAGWHDKRWNYAQNFQNTYFPNDVFAGQIYAAANELKTQYPSVYNTITSDAPSATKAYQLGKIYEGAGIVAADARQLNADQIIRAVGANPNLVSSAGVVPSAAQAGAAPLSAMTAAGLRQQLADMPAPAPTPVNAAQSFAEPPVPTPNIAAVNAEATAPGSATKSLDSMPVATTADQLRQQLATIPSPRVDPRILQQQAVAQIPADPTYKGLTGPGTYAGAGDIVRANLQGSVPGATQGFQTLMGSGMAAFPSQGRAGITNTLTDWFNNLPPAVKAAQANQFIQNPKLFAENTPTDPVQAAEFKAGVQAALASPEYIQNYTNRPLSVTSDTTPASTSFAAPQLSYNPASAQSMVATPVASSVIRQSINPNPYSTAAPQNLYSGAPAVAANQPQQFTPQMPPGYAMPFGVTGEAMPGVTPSISSGPMPTAQLGIAGASGLQGYTPPISGANQSIHIPTGANPPVTIPPNSSDTFAMPWGANGPLGYNVTNVSDIVPQQPMSPSLSSPGGAASPGAPAAPHIGGVIGAVLHGLGNLFSGGTSANNGGFYSATVPGGYVSNYGFGSLGGGQFGNMGAASQFGGGAYGAPGSTT